MEGEEESGRLLRLPQQEGRVLAGHAQVSGLRDVGTGENVPFPRFGRVTKTKKRNSIDSDDILSYMSPGGYGVCGA